MTQLSEEPIITKTAVYWGIVLGLVHPFYLVMFRPRVRGLEHLPREGGALIAANHQSFLDIPLVAMAGWPRHIAFMARDSLASAGWLAWVMKWTGAIMVRRGAADREALRRATKHLELGDLVAVFPEGTRSIDGRLGDFKRGAVLAARMSGAPIIPCGIRGSFDAWPRQARVPRPRRLEVTFGAPIDSSRSDALDRVREAIAELSGETLETPSPGDAVARS